MSALLAVPALLLASIFATPESGPQERAAPESATVTIEANLRDAPATSAKVLDVMPVGTATTIECYVYGEKVRDTAMWLSADDGWIHSTLVTPVSVGECPGGYVPPAGRVGDLDCADFDGPVPSSHPRFQEDLDADGDGMGCEWNDGPVETG
jgi:hypothetical protein